MNRPKIPAELKRRILVEAGHRCAIPTCRSTQVEIAHIKPWSKVKKHEYDNLISLCPNCHTRFDNGEIDQKSMIHYKLQLKFAIEKYSRYEMDVLHLLYNSPPNSALPTQSYLILLTKAALDDDLLRIESAQYSVIISGVKANTDFIYITGKGRHFMADFISNKGMSYDNVGEL